MTVAALVISWFVAVYFVPYLGTLLLKASRTTGDGGQPHELFDTPFYRALPRAGRTGACEHRWLTIGADRC